MASRSRQVAEGGSAFTAIGCIILGYLATGNLFLGLATLGIVFMFLIAFVLSYLYPRLHDRFQHYPRR